MWRQAETQEEKFKEVTAGERDAEGNLIYYNGDEIYKEITRIKSEIESRKKKLKNEVFQVTKEKIKMEDETSKKFKKKHKISGFKLPINWKKEKLLPSLLTLLTLVVIITCGMFRFGFRITYDPTIITDWNAVSGCAAWAGVAVSAVAIWYAIQVPKKIADRGNAIELFEKRHAVYDALNHCLIFADELNLLMEIADDRFEIFCISFNLPLAEDLTKRKNLISQKTYEITLALTQAAFLFDKEISEEIKNLCLKFVILTGKPNLSDDDVKKTKDEYVKCADNIKKRIIPLMEQKLTLD